MLALQAQDDGVVSSRGLKHLRKWAKDEQSEVALLPRGTHALTRGDARREVFERIYQFAQKIEAASPTS